MHVIQRWTIAEGWHCGASNRTECPSLIKASQVKRKSAELGDRSAIARLSRRISPTTPTDLLATTRDPLSTSAKVRICTPIDCPSVSVLENPAKIRAVTLGSNFTARISCQVSFCRCKSCGLELVFSVVDLYFRTVDQLISIKPSYYSKAISKIYIIIFSIVLHMEIFNYKGLPGLAERR